MMKCCVMQAYFRADTTANKVAWGVFAGSLVLALVFTPLGVSRSSDCVNKWTACINKHGGTDPDNTCQQILYDCHFMDWYQMFMWGIILFITAGVVLCYFWCCAVPPGYRGRDGGGYAVTGSYQVAQPIPPNPFETTPLFHAAVYSSVPHQHQQYMQPYPPHGLPPPPPYQFAQLYPAHNPGVQMQPFVPPTYTVTLSSEPSLAAGTASLGYDASFGGGPHPAISAAAPAPSPAFGSAVPGASREGSISLSELHGKPPEGSGSPGRLGSAETQSQADFSFPAPPTPPPFGSADSIGLTPAEPATPTPAAAAATAAGTAAAAAASQDRDRPPATTPPAPTTDHLL